LKLTQQITFTRLFFGYFKETLFRNSLNFSFRDFFALTILAITFSILLQLIHQHVIWLFLRIISKIKQQQGFK